MAVLSNAASAGCGKRSFAITPTFWMTLHSMRR